MRWIRKTEITDDQVKDYSTQLNIDIVLARILLNRNIDVSTARIMLDEIYDGILEPSLLANAEAAAEVIAQYCEDPNAIIFIFGDYDADGVTAGYVMAMPLREVAKCRIEVYYPERSEGYGLNMDFCKSVVDYAKEENKPVLVITVDNGITKIEEVEYLQSHGVEVIVTDHHVAKENVPNCIIVDPHNNGEPNTFKHLSGCGVAFKVAQLVQRHFNKYNMMNYTFAVAIGTLADVMPLNTENIALVQYGLQQLNSKDCPRGIQYFKDYMGKQKLNALDITWELAPRINACGRMGNIGLASKFFFCEDLESDSEVEDVVLAIEKLNEQRKAATKKAEKKMSELNFDNDNVCVFDATGCPQGIVGVIAGKLTEKTGKPSIVIAGTKDELIGSARGIDGINLQEIFQHEIEKGNLIEFGGHSVAAGITVSKNKIEDLKQSLNEQLEGMNQVTGVINEEEPELIIDDIITLKDINEKMYDIINEIPYDNKTLVSPVFALTYVQVISYHTSKSNENNICFKLKDETGKIMDIWGWGVTKQYEEIGKPSTIHIAGSIDRNFQNKKEFTLKILDLMEA
jgi:single-stranded-DNA-specific exonuclease